MPDAPTLALLAKALGDKYEVKKLVGQGGFAEVYEVWDKDLERRLAVKVLRADVAWTPGTIERFQRETRAAAKDRKSTRLNSSHITISYAVFCLKKKKK